MTDNTEGQGRAVVLPNGERRIDYIRDAYYNREETRSDIKKAINEMLGDTGEITYQIVFSATKTEEDPRIAAAVRSEERATAKAEKEAAAAKAKAAKAKDSK